MAKDIPRHYFEASVYVAVLKREVVDEHPRWWHCAKLLEDVADGKAIAVTSSITIAEVTSGKGKRPHSNTVDQITGFFENDYIYLVDTDRWIAAHARELIWTLSLNQVDAIHLASAIAAECDVLYTYDDQLLRCSGKLPIRIEQPIWSGATQSILEGLDDSSS